jgi:hypothetical protein
MKSRRMRWAVHMARMGTTRNAYRILVGMSERKRPLETLRLGKENDIKMDPKEIRLVLDRYQWRAIVKAVMNLRVQ